MSSAKWRPFCLGLNVLIDNMVNIFASISGMNIFVAFFVLLLLLAESTPPAASSIPLIGNTGIVKI